MNNKKYYTIKSITLCKALNFVGISYYAHGHGEDKYYTVEDTPKFREALTILTQLRKQNLDNK